MASIPVIKVEIDTGVSMTSPASPTWQDITSYVRNISYTLDGRTETLGRTGTGTLRATVDNRTGKFDVSGVGSPFVSDLRLHRIRVTATWASVVYPRWSGWIQTVDDTYPLGGRDDVAQISAATNLYVCNLYDLNTAQEANPGNFLPAEHGHDRFLRVCAFIPGLFAGVGGYQADTATSASTVAAMGSFDDSGVWQSDVSKGNGALSHLQALEDTEGGRIFTKRDGTLWYEGRHWRATNSASSLGTLGDGGGTEIPYTMVSGGIMADDANIWNRASITPKGADAPVTAVNLTSEDHYGSRTMEATFLTDSYWDCLAAAQTIVDAQGAPAPRIPALTLRPQAMASPNWAAVLGMENSQRWTVKRRRSYGTITIPAFIEQISESVDPSSVWDTTIQLLPVADFVAGGMGATHWVLGTSRLGTDTYLQY
jgi:hypothetical protein